MVLNCVVLLILTLSIGEVTNAATMSNPEIVNDKFYYFGFGSNLNSHRIHIKNPTAQRKNIGKLKEYRLDFYFNNTRWRGAAATIVPQAGREVWGAIWEIGIENMAHLDKQEGVHKQVYRPLRLPIETPEGEILMCRAYQLVQNPPDLPDGAETPNDRQPSQTYLEIIIEGAIESGLPQTYIDFLKKVTHNGNVVVSATTRAIERAKKRANNAQSKLNANELIIKGVPMLPRESNVDTYLKITAAVGYAPNTAPPVEVFRLGKKKPGARYDPPLIVRFTNMIDRNTFYEKYFAYGRLSLIDLGLSTNRRIFISENLTKHNQLIYVSAMKLRFEKKISSVSTSRGVVHIRRKEGERPQPIHSESDLYDGI